MNLDDERALVERAKASAEGFGELYDRYYDRLYAYAYRRTASRQETEDITSAIFEEVLRGIGRFQWRDIPLSAWLYRIANNVISDHYRQRYRAEAVELARVVETASDGQGPEEWIAQQEGREAMKRALAALSQRDQDVINLVFFEDLPREEVARVLGCSVANVYVRLHRALQRLRRQMDEEVEHG